MSTRVMWPVLAAVLGACASPAPLTPSNADRAQVPRSSGPEPAEVAATKPASPLLAEGFVELGESRGVKVYRRDVLPGIELAAEGIFEAPPREVRRVLLDYASHRRWQTRLKESRILATGTDELLVYQRLELPMLDDRDFTLRVRWGEEGEASWVHFATTKDRAPAPVPGVVRVTQHEGGWRLEPARGGRATRASYRFHIDLAGSFPAWMGRGRAATDLPDFFEALGHQLGTAPR